MARVKVTPERYIPKGSKPVTVKGVDAIVYVNGLSAIAYHGKSNKKDFYIRFPNEGYRDKYIADYFDGRKEREAAKAKMAAERSKPNELKVGDILSNVWGWEQTNVDFFQVIESKGQTVKIREIGQELQVDDTKGAMSGYVTPIKDQFTDKPVLTKRVIFGKNVSSKYGCFGLWDGRPERCSWYA
jgi:hypothetical protein